MSDAPRARLTVTTQASLQRPGLPPDGERLGFHRWLGSGEQPYRRELRVGPEWVPLDLGWLAGDAVGFLVLSNPRERRRAAPTAEEAALAEARVIEVGFMVREAGPRRKVGMWEDPKAAPEGPTACLLVPPGESLPVTPADAGLIHVRCPAGEVRASLWLVPR